MLTLDISIHAPRTGSDADRTEINHIGLFQSTLPARGATLSRLKAAEHHVFQSTLPARGATSKGDVVGRDILIFQSTLPARGATARVQEASAKG